MISAVVFDLGNVLIDWQPLPAIARGVGDEEAQAFLSSFDFYAWNLRQDGGRPFAEAEAQAIAAHPQWRDHLLAYRRHFADSLVGEIEGTVAILHELHEAGVPVFALTNWSAETFPIAREHFDWLDLLEDVVVSGQEGVAKPDPEIFAVLQRRTARPAGELFFVDDSERNVAAARASGLTAVVFTSPEGLRSDLLAAGVLPV